MGDDEQRGGDAVALGEAVDEAAGLAARAARIRRMLEAQAPEAEARRRQAERVRLRTRVMGAFSQRNIPTDDGVRRVVLAEADPPGEILAAFRRMLAWRSAQDRRVALVGVALGKVDTGKTSALARLVAHWPEPAYYVRADLMPHPTNPIEGVAFELQAEYASERKRLLDADLLTIDELGAEAHPDWVVRMCLLRYDMRKATLLAGNLTADEFRHRYGDERLRSRVLDRQPCAEPTMVQAHRDVRLSQRGLTP